jgi:hypothetical protein
MGLYIAFDFFRIVTVSGYEYNPKCHFHSNPPNISSDIIGISGIPKYALSHNIASDPTFGALVGFGSNVLDLVHQT